MLICGDWEMQTVSGVEGGGGSIKLQDYKILHLGGSWWGRWENELPQEFRDGS